MSELSVWDLDGTIRPGSLLAEAISHGIQEGFIDAADYQDPAQPTYAEVDNFVHSITQRSRRDFHGLTDRLADEARTQAYPWALERLEGQSERGYVVVLSHSPAFLVKAFCRGLDITNACGSYFHTKELVFSGRAVTLDKSRALARHLRRTGIARVDFAAGDSEADLPLLTRAEQAVVVNPKRQLAELALQNKWEIIEA